MTAARANPTAHNINNKFKLKKGKKNNIYRQYYTVNDNDNDDDEKTNLQRQLINNPNYFLKNKTAKLSPASNLQLWESLRVSFL